MGPPGQASLAEPRTKTTFMVASLLLAVKKDQRRHRVNFVDSIHKPR
jgi:hypothetical protein